MCNISDSNEVIANMHSSYDVHKQVIETKTKRTLLNREGEKENDEEEDRK
jgi:hypothetical protein